jgi:hypothetical protein
MCMRAGPWPALAIQCVADAMPRHAKMTWHKMVLACCHTRHVADAKACKLTRLKTVWLKPSKPPCRCKGVRR